MCFNTTFHSLVLIAMVERLLLYSAKYSRNIKSGEVGLYGVWTGRLMVDNSCDTVPLGPSLVWMTAWIASFYTPREYTRTDLFDEYSTIHSLNSRCYYTQEQIYLTDTRQIHALNSRCYSSRTNTLYLSRVLPMCLRGYSSTVRYLPPDFESVCWWSTDTINIINHNEVRGHETDSMNSGVEGYLRK